MGPGLPGKLPDGGAPAAATPLGVPSWLASFQTNWNPLTAFAEKKSRKILFLADGETPQRVTDALVANEVGKVGEIVLVFERPE